MNKQQYYLDENKQIDISVDIWTHGRMHVSIYNDRNDTCVAYTCSREELNGLADFLYKTIGEKK
jgi:Tfp pilus assembly pilus retraction ATPase PilT